MSNVLENMKTRRSIRKYKSDPIPQEILDQIIEAGLYAASGMGTQTLLLFRSQTQNCEMNLPKKTERSVAGKKGLIRFTQLRQCWLYWGKKETPIVFMTAVW